MGGTADGIPMGKTLEKIRIANHQGRIDMPIEDGVVVIFSDAHFWPGFKTTANRALLTLLKQLKPTLVINNGDAFDGAQISRFPRPFFDEAKPSVLDEMRVCDERLTEIKAASGSAKLIWCLGNHDLRFEARLAANNPEYQGIKGFHLKDHFPEWLPAWSCWLNDEIEIRHRIRGGIHATWNNIHATHNKCTITGHLHNLMVRPFTDARGVMKYGVDTGTLADSDGPQFVDYMEGRQPNWRSGFVVLTFKNGQMLMPELVQKFDEDHVEFRGHLIHADTGAIS
jgi:3',5'-cyclic AMP phosphodiesterase CpdA